MEVLSTFSTNDQSLRQWSQLRLDNRVVVPAKTHLGSIVTSAEVAGEIGPLHQPSFFRNLSIEASLKNRFLKSRSPDPGAETDFLFSFSTSPF